MKSYGDLEYCRRGKVPLTATSRHGSTRATRPTLMLDR